MRLLVCLIFLISSFRLSGQQLCTWIGAVSGQWEDANNWKNQVMPGAVDSVLIVNYSKTIFLNEAKQISQLTINKAVLDLQGNRLTIGHKTIIQAGEINNGEMSCVGLLSVFGLSGAVKINAKLTAECDSMSFRNTSFDQLLSLTKTGKSNDNSFGGNVFKQGLKLHNKGSGFITFAASRADSMLGKAVFIVDQQAGFIQIAPSSQGNYFNDSVVLSCQGSGIRFCQSNGKVNFGENAKLLIGDGGFGKGILLFRNLNYLSTHKVTLLLSDSAQVYLQTNNIWNAELGIISPSIRIDSNIFNQEVKLSKTGYSNDVFLGANVFKKYCSISNNGSGNLVLANLRGDTFFDSLYVTSLSKGLIHLSYSDTSKYTGPIILNSIGGSGIRFGQNKGRSVFANQTQLSSNVFNSGDLYLKGIEAGATTFSLSDSAGLITQFPCVFNGDVNISSPNIRIDSTVFRGDASLHKLGKLNEICVGGNTFEGKLNLRVSGAGYLTFGASSPDNYQDSVNVSCDSSGVIYLAHGSLNNRFEKALYFESKGAGIRVGQNNGSAVIKGDIVITSFNSGSLQLRNVSQIAGETRLSLSDSASVYFQPANKWQGKVYLLAPSIRVDSNSFSKLAVFVKTGKPNDFWSGGNNFADTCLLTNEGDGSITWSNIWPDTVQHLICNSKKGLLLLAQSTSGNYVSGSLSLFSTGAGIRLGQNKGGLVLGSQAVLICSSDKFIKGSLLIKGLISRSEVPFNLSLGDSASIHLQSRTTWQGVLRISAPSIRVDSNTFLNKTVLIKKGASNDVCQGGNQFMKHTSLVNEGAGTWNFAQQKADYFADSLWLHLENKATIQLNNGPDTAYFDAPLLVNSLLGSLRIGQSGGLSIFRSNATLKVLQAEKSTIYLKSCHFFNRDSLYIELKDSSTVYLQTNTLFKGIVSLKSPSVRLDGSRFEAKAYFEKTGKSNDGGLGGCRFEQDLYLDVAQGGGYLSLSANSLSDEFLGNVFISNKGAGVRFGQLGAPSYFANGTVHIGEKGYYNASLVLKKVIVNAPLTKLLLDSTAVLQIQDSCIFNCKLNVVAGGITSAWSNYLDSVSFTKTGINNDLYYGGNVFSKGFYLSNSGQFTSFLAFAKGDVYQENLWLNNTGIGNISLAYRDSSFLGGNMYLLGNKAPAFGQADGAIIFDGKQQQEIIYDNTIADLFIRNLGIRKKQGVLKFSKTVNITGQLYFDEGVIEMEDDALMIFGVIAKAINPNLKSYVNGGITKIGAEPFLFPTGNAKHYKPLGISQGFNLSDRTTVNYYAFTYFIDSNQFNPLVFRHINLNEYWFVEKSNSRANTFFTLSWDKSNTKLGPYYEDYTVAAFTDGELKNLGALLSEGNAQQGKVSSALPTDGFCVLFLAQSYAERPFISPLQQLSAEKIDSLHIALQWQHFNDSNNKYYIVQKLNEKGVFQNLDTLSITGIGLNSYHYLDLNTKIGENTYRLELQDNNQEYTFSNAVKVFILESDSFTVYPNPCSAFINLRGEGIRKEQIEVNIYNATGKLIEQMVCLPNDFYLNQRITTNTWPNGLYILKIGTGQQIKFIKQ